MVGRPIPPDLLPWALAGIAAQSGDGAAPAAAAGVAANHEPALTVIAGDASNRRYFRLKLGEQTYVVAEAPPATEKNPEFLAVRQLLADAGVRVPALLAADLERGYLLLEDLGDRLLLPALSDQTVDGYYQQCFSVLHCLALAGKAGPALPAYDEALLSEELSRFPEWFVGKLLGYELDAKDKTAVEALADMLVTNALAQPRVLVHRDFHSRNLMIQPDGELAVIDFQDAVLGPVTYDLVSLLRDCYIRWPQDRVREWALAYRDSLVRQDLLEPIADAEFLRWFDWLGLQRHIKVLGTFARLYLRDGKEAYLDDLPMVIAYVEEVLDVYAPQETAFAHFRDWFARELKPRIVQQDWSTAL